MKRIIDKVRFKAMRFVVSNFSATPFVKYRELVKGKIGKYDGESLIVDSAKLRSVGVMAFKCLDV